MAEPKVFEFRSEVYFDELDALWVLHHSRYLHHLERAQQAFFQALLGVDDFDHLRDEDIYVVVRNLDIDFKSPVRTPGPILIRFQLARIRAAGVTMDFEILSGDGEIVHCAGKRTVCKLSGATHQPAEWSAPFRAAMEAWK
ncbi:MAG: thioesterase family protein [Verrucomicrobiota bacterium]